MVRKHKRTKNKNVVRWHDEKVEPLGHPLRCPACGEMVFGIYRTFSGGERGKLTEVAFCLECEGDTFVSHLKVAYPKIER